MSAQGTMSGMSHREALLGAARELLREKGLSRTTARDLAGASGANLRSIGYHFGSKDELMAQVLAQICAEWTAGPVEASRVEGGSPQERMLAAVRTMLTDLPGKRDDYFAYLDGVLEARQNSELSGQLTHGLSQSLGSIAGAISDATPALSPGVAVLLARLLVAVHDGLMLQVAVADDGDLHDIEELVSALAGLGVTLAAGLEFPGAAETLRTLIAEP
jgi:AcrR family transcriptional regulator